MTHAHALGTIKGCVVRTAEDLRTRMLAVAERCRFNVRSECFVQFKPEGATGVLVLAESHFSAHTFPEEASLRVDAYCCSPDFNPSEFMREAEEAFGATGTWRVIER